jgi:hypothetical protein
MHLPANRLNTGKIMNAVDIKPIFPIDGDVLHALDGNTTPEGLVITIKVTALPGSIVQINDIPALEVDGTFTAPLVLTRYRNEIQIREKLSNQQKTLHVYWVPRFAGKYRLSIDDNIRFLQDIALHAASYQSIFDNPFLKDLQKIHYRYQTKVHLNLFYQSEQGDFNLSQFPEKFKEEWEENTSWLRLSFHAYQEFPDAPYKEASYDTVKQDCDLVQKEIQRFAGSALMGPVTTVHWGEVTIEGSRALRAGGHKGQLGYFNVDDDLPPVSYYLNVAQRRHMKKRFIWKDEAEDIVFIRSSIVLDRKNKAEIVPFLEAYRGQQGLPPYADFLIHEQYYYPDYSAYQPDYFEKIEAAVQWAASNGYMPAFLEECIFN